MMGDKRKKGKGGKRSRDGSEIQVKMPPSYPSTDVGLLSFVLMSDSQKNFKFMFHVCSSFISIMNIISSYRNNFCYE